MHRRAFLCTAAAPLLARAASSKLSAIGFQLYTVRSVIGDRPLETLEAIHKIGYREVELTFATLDQIWPSVQKAGLKPVSVHLDPLMFTKRKDELPAAIENVARRGLKYVVCPAIAQEDRGGEEAMKKFASHLNHAGELAKKSGLRLCYHNHAFEFAPAGPATQLDILFTNSDPGLVQLELDMMWAQVAGVNPVSVLEKYKGRVPLMHLKDVKKGTEFRFNERIPRDAFSEVGKGMIDTPAVLRAAAAARVKHYFVEQDQTPGHPVASLEESYRYLRSLRF